jgi:hypothetical protein
MFSLRDTIASALLGVQFSPEEETVNSTGDKKGKKKAHKKRASKTKAKADAQRTSAPNTVNETGSDSDEDADSDEDDADITNFGNNSAQAIEAKTTSALFHQFESTQIGKSICRLASSLRLWVTYCVLVHTEDPLQIMIRKLAAECKVDAHLVSETVNRMFDLGLQYDDYDAVKKELVPKVIIIRRQSFAIVVSIP